MSEVMCGHCGRHQAMHAIVFRGTTYGLCCGCNVKTGETPADWHSVCMATVRGDVVALNEHSRGGRPPWGVVGRGVRV